MSLEFNNPEVSRPLTALEGLAERVKDAEMNSVNDAVDCYGCHLLEYGLKECTDCAKEVFTPEVIENWGNLSPEERAKVAMDYADKVSESFGLSKYHGVVIEDMQPGCNGYNRGDGYAHLNANLIKGDASPFQVMDTITHELRHQYQMECLGGYHPIPEETYKEWKKGLEIYTNDSPWAYDPWGYKYNPLELDARYAGESVVREISKDYINENYA